MGEMPILIDQDTNTKEGLQLLHDAGFNINSKIYRYKDEYDHIKQTQILIRQGWKMVTQHVFPVDEIAPENCLVAPATLSYLNNKENLPNLVPSIYVPHRKIIATSSLLNEVDKPDQLPIVIKAVTDLSSGGGTDIMICNTPEDLHNAADYFKVCDKIIIEDYMEIINNYCVNYAVSNSGKIFVVGASEQIMDKHGQQFGNWIGQGVNASDQVIKAGYEVMKNAASRDYIGFAGLDIAVLKDNSIKVFDLNFRYNASTVPLLIYDSVVKRIRKPVILLHAWESKGAFKDLIKIARTALRDGYFIPINSYNCRDMERPNARHILFGLMCGSTREEVYECNNEFLKLGYY